MAISLTYLPKAGSNIIENFTHNIANDTLTETTVIVCHMPNGLLVCNVVNYFGSSKVQFMEDLDKKITCKRERGNLWLWIRLFDSVKETKEKDLSCN